MWYTFDLESNSSRLNVILNPDNRGCDEKNAVFKGTNRDGHSRKLLKINEYKSISNHLLESISWVLRNQSLCQHCRTSRSPGPPMKRDPHQVMMMTMLKSIKKVPLEKETIFNLMKPIAVHLIWPKLWPQIPPQNWYNHIKYIQLLTNEASFPNFIRKSSISNRRFKRRSLMSINQGLNIASTSRSQVKREKNKEREREREAYTM